MDMSYLEEDIHSSAFFMSRMYIHPVFVSLTKREFELLWFFAGKMDAKNKAATSKLFVDEVRKGMGVSSKRIYSMIGSMVEKEALCRLSRSDYMINPSIFFKCKASGLKRLQTEFDNRVKKPISPIDMPNEEFLREVESKKWKDGEEANIW